MAFVVFVICITPNSPSPFPPYQVLFLYFGLKLLYDSLSMSGEGVSEELIEVEEELVNKKNDQG
ncbi:hypothetical protein EON63_14605, partial [archaeon]